MYDVKDIANVFIELSNSEPEGDVTNLKLNKLLYFAQGWSLALFNKPLFDTPIEAWKYGPVVPSIYHKYKKYEKCPIAQEDNDNVEIDSQTISLLLDVYDAYSKYSASELMRQTHQQGTPWTDCYVPKADNVITNEAISEWFSKQPKIKEWKFPDLPSIGHIDKDGYTVLPKDWDDE